MIDGFDNADKIDLAGDGLATSATLGPNNVLTISGGSGGPITLQLDPGQDFSGDVFKVTSDGAVGTNVSVAPDQAPVAQDGSAGGDEDHAISGQAVANDPDGLPSPLSYNVVDGPQHGQLDFHADFTFTYTPEQDFNGGDSFTFKANDGILDSNTSTVSMTINPVNDAPVFTSPASFAVAENHMAVGTVMAVDPEHDSFLFALTGGADEAFVSIDAHTGALNFLNSPDFETPADANHDNSYNIVVSATDVFGAANTQTVSVNVTNLTEPGQTINGGNGNQVLTGTTGNDTINGGNGNDTINGGDGNDNISGGNGNDAVIGGRGDDVIDGGNGDDTLDGGSGNNQLYGGNGNDILHAGDGNNLFDGGNGDDIITAGNGNNNISGGNGSDIFHVGTGNNTLTGGNGNDTFVFGPGFGKNVVTDFSHGDHIEFDGGIFANFTAVQADMHQVGVDTVVSLDADHSITLQNVVASSLHASDFLLH